jgi:integrase
MRLNIKWVNGWAHVHGYRPDGKRYRRALQTKDANRAEELRSQIETEIWSVHMYGLKAVVTFDQAALEYAQDGGDTRFLVGITEQLTGMLLKDITPRIIRAAAKKAYPDGAGATLNRQGITPARAVINYAHGEGWCAPIRVKAFEVKKPKRKAVGYEYLLALQPHLTVERRFPNAPPYLFAMLLFLHTTGRRVGDAIKLTPDDIKWDINKAHIDKTKNGTEAYASLVPVLADMLREMPPRHGRVFGYLDRRSVYKSLKMACAAAGVEYLGTHQVGRHSFATSLEKLGWSAKQIADAGGWKSPRLVAETYIHTDDSGERATAEIGKNWSSPLRVVK